MAMSSRIGAVALRPGKRPLSVPFVSRYISDPNEIVAPQSLCLRSLTMNIEALHAAFGLAFTFVWLIVGQIIVDGN